MADRLLAKGQGRVTMLMAFQDLLVWQKAHAVALDVYRHTASFPVEERFGLTSQMRRCAVSIPSNIAEGSGRNGDVEFARFMDVALGSANEPRGDQLLLVATLSY
ncbi:MAG: four helix bundle protein [Dehalococcoidia bacterium]|nr:four helix bundle protein [Dehalococcoidia bacterium]